MSRNNHLYRYAALIDSMLAIALPDKPRDSRSVYQPLLVYSRLLEMEKIGALDSSIRSLIEPMDDGAWPSLIRRVAGELFAEPAWVDRARDGFAHLCAEQHSSGLFLPPDDRANPEVRWYEELVLLHAAASYAARVPGDAIASAVRTSAAYHLSEIQPDHATSEPWGLLAFIQYAPPLADQVLHALSVQHPTGIGGIPLLLLVDVRYGLRRLI
jgi:hypothetical protein